jgi:hypothetical protein
MRWESLLSVFAVALASTVAVVVLATLALLGLSARAPFTPLMGRTLAGACLGATAAIVSFGLWAIVAR